MVGGRFVRELRGMWRSLQYDLIRGVRRLRYSRLRHVPIVLGVLGVIVVGGAGVTAAAFQLRPDVPPPPLGSKTTLPPMQSPTATAFVTLTPPPSGVPTTLTATATETATATTRSTATWWQTSEVHVPGPTYVRVEPGPTMTTTATATVPGPTIYITTSASPSPSTPTATPTDDPSSDNSG